MTTRVKADDPPLSSLPPFFLAVGFHLPHEPYLFPERSWEEYEGIEMPLYVASALLRFWIRFSARIAPSSFVHALAEISLIHLLHPLPTMGFRFVFARILFLS